MAVPLLTGITSQISPTDIPGLSFWLDAQDASIVTSNANSIVTGVRDKGPNARNLTNTMTTDGFRYNQPGTLFNGSYPSFYYNGAAQNLTLGSNSSFSISQPATVFTVQQVVGSAINQDVFDSTDAGNRFFGFYFLGTPTSPNYRIFAGTTLSPLNNTNLSPAVYSQYFNGTNSQIFENGVTTIRGDAGIQGSTGITIGSRHTQTQETFQGHICEVIYYNSVLSDTNRERIEGYLAQKWGLQSRLPLTHGYRFPPQLSLSLSTAFNPLSIPGIVVWLDAADTSSFIFSSGVNISQWLNKVGGATPAFASGTPTLQTNSINGRQSVLMGSGNYLAGGATVSGTTVTCFAVAVTSAAQPRSGGDQRLISMTNTLGNDFDNAQSVVGLFNQNATSTIATFRSSTLISSSPITQNVPFLAGSIYNGTNGQVFKDGTAGTGPTASVGTFGIVKYSLGVIANAVDTTHNWIGNIGEILVFNSALTTDQRQQVEGYLAWKWGLQGSLPANHPNAVVPLFLPTVVPYSLPPLLTVAPSFSPLSIAGIRLWLDAADSSTLSLTGTTVTAWRDKSGLGNNTTVAGSPVIGNNINSRQAITTGVNNFFTGPVSITTTTLTCFAVATTTLTMPNSLGGGRDQRLVSLANGLNVDYGRTDGAIALFNQQATSSITVWRVSGPLANNTIVTNTPFQANSQFDGTNATLRFNGSPGTLASSASSGTFAITKYGIGNQANPVSEFWLGFVGEVILYNTALTIAERQTVEGYLAWKWGIQDGLPAGHPFKLYPPPP